MSSAYSVAAGGPAARSKRAMSARVLVAAYQSAMGALAGQAIAASSSSVIRTRFESTRTPGPIVDESVIERI